MVPQALSVEGRFAEFSGDVIGVDCRYRMFTLEFRRAHMQVGSFRSNHLLCVMDLLAEDDIRWSLLLVAQSAAKEVPARTAMIAAV